MTGTHRRKRPVSRLAIALVAAVAVAASASAALAEGGGGPGQERSFASPGHFADHKLDALTANPDCTLKVPRHPLSAAGLATPYVLSSAGLTCTENEAAGAFVQAVILDPATGALSVYDPEVVTAGTVPAVTPPVPALPPNAVVALWTGFNGNRLRLTGPGAGDFTNFAQQSYDNSPQFFRALRRAVSGGLVKVPPVGTASDGLACPTSRDFSLVDQDQSDNVPVTYAGALGGASNGSDEQLLNLVQASLGCSEWKVPLLDPQVAAGDGAGMSTAGILQEEQASVYQQAPVALVPGNDEFVTTDGNFVPPNGDGQPDLFLQDLYRAQVGQPLTGNSHDTLAYCQNLSSAGAVRLGQDAATEAKSPAPAFAQIGTNLANVLAGRFVATWQLLGCQGLTGQPSPVAVTVDPATMLVTSATYPSAATPVAATTTPAPGPADTSTGTTPPQEGHHVTVFACEAPGGGISMLQGGTAPACPAGDTPVSWRAAAG